MTNPEAQDREAESWTIAITQWPDFQIVRAQPLPYHAFGSDADLNGTFPTKLAAVEEVIGSLEDARAALSASITKAKRMRGRLQRIQQWLSR